MSTDAPPTSVTVSTPASLNTARVVRGLERLIEAALALTVAGSVLAFGSVHPWAYRALWVASVVAAAIALARALAVRQLRQALGPGAHEAALHSGGRWLVIDPPSAERAISWSIDLDAPALPRGPLLLPALAMLALGLLQLAPLPGGPVTVDAEATRRGLTFVLAFGLLHQAAAAAFGQRRARRRFRQWVAWLGAAVALVALAQLAAGTRRIYGFFEPLEGGQPFGPFVNRNHFAGFMLLAIPVALSLLADAWRAYASRLGEGLKLRRALVRLQTPEGAALLYAALPPLVGIGALLASTSRGGILAFFASLALAAGRGARAARNAGVGGGARLRGHGAHVVRPGAARGALPAGRGRRAGPHAGVARLGRGDLLARAGSRATASTPTPRRSRGCRRGRCRAARRRGRMRWRGRSPPARGSATARPTAWPGSRGTARLTTTTCSSSSRPAVPGLVVGLWAAFAALAAARRDPWVFAALAGVLMHSFVDFDLQIPAIPALFVCLAALARPSGLVPQRP